MAAKFFMQIAYEQVQSYYNYSYRLCGESILRTVSVLTWLFLNDFYDFVKPFLIVFLIYLRKHVNQVTTGFTETTLNYLYIVLY